MNQDEGSKSKWIQRWNRERRPDQIDGDVAELSEGANPLVGYDWQSGNEGQDVITGASDLRGSNTHIDQIIGLPPKGAEGLFEFNRQHGIEGVGVIMGASDSGLPERRALQIIQLPEETANQLTDVYRPQTQGRLGSDTESSHFDAEDSPVVLGKSFKAIVDRVPYSAPTSEDGAVSTGGPADETGSQLAQPTLEDGGGRSNNDLSEPLREAAGPPSGGSSGPPRGGAGGGDGGGGWGGGDDDE